MLNNQLSKAMTRTMQAAPLSESGATDGRLLTRFILTRDETAFRDLVQRLGPMVLGVCRRVTGNAHLAEDAFQAAFLVLARRAADVRPREALRGWLYGVASRTARKARAMSLRQCNREILLPSVPDRAAEPTYRPDSDALRILDEEVGDLPDHLRIAVVLCELEGLSRKEAASRLGVPMGTLASRLAKARKVLAERLRKRNVSLAAYGLGCALERLATAALPPCLATGTAALVDGAVPVPLAVAELLHGVLKTMFLTKLKVVLLSGLLLAVAGWAVTSLFDSGTVAGQPPVPKTSRPASEAQPDEKKSQQAGVGTLLLTRSDGLITLTPEGKKGREIPVPKGTHLCSNGPPKALLSPDGTRVAFVVSEVRSTPLEDASKPWPFKVVVSKLDATESVIADIPAYRVILNWTADGSRVVVTKMSGGTFESGVENVLLDPATGKTEPLALPVGTWVLDCGRDGKTFLVTVSDGEKWSLGLASIGVKQVKRLIKLKGCGADSIGRLSPDGKRVLYTDVDPKDWDAYKMGLSSLPYILDVGTKKRTEVEEFPDHVGCRGISWSPDGKQIAYTWEQLHPDELRKEWHHQNLTPTKVCLIIADSDGSNPRKVASHLAKWPSHMSAVGRESVSFWMIDWR